MTASAPSAVELKHVARRFVTPNGEILSALEDFDLTIAPGEFFAIVGPTGCGKSTTLGLIAGLARPQAGEVTLFDAPVDGVDRRVGFVFQQDAVFPWRSVLGNVMAGPLFRGVPKAKAESTARDWIARVGLKGFEAHYPHQLSGGMRKRVALAQTFINNPQVLLMDEPFSALDVQTRELMQEELLQLWADAKSAVLFVTHDLDEAILLADRVAVLTTRPARVKSVHTIDLPRPRNVATLRYDEKFIAIARSISDDLREEVLRARAGH
jgi:NitT/TauT family transport system ATP-binding protein